MSEIVTLETGRRNLLRMRQELLLTNYELAIVERGIAALDYLLRRSAENAAESRDE